MYFCAIRSRDRPIYRPGRDIGRYLGFTDISISAVRSWQNADILLTHPDNFRKKVQRSKSRQLSYNNASRCGIIANRQD